MLRSFFACLAVSTALLLVPAAALAQSAVGDQYCDPLATNGCSHKASAGGGSSNGGSANGGGSSNGGSAAAASAGGSGSGSASSNMSEARANKVDPKTGLPATGVPVGAILGFGVALLASGLALRRLADDTGR